jgi:hypothetical protein
MILALLQHEAEKAAEGHGGGHEGGGHHAPHSIFTKLWESVSHTSLGPLVPASTTPSSASSGSTRSASR